jgi:excisionase family DNA binding protein
MEQLVSIRAAAARLDCKEGTVRSWIRQDLIPAVKIGRLRRIRQADLEAVLQFGLPAPDAVKAA